MKFATKAVHAGISPDPTTGAIIPPIYQTATYTLEEVGQTKGFDYSRGANPTRATLEDNIAALEGGRYAVSFASGMAAVDAITRLLSAGDHIISTDDVYGGVVRLFDQILTRYQMEFTYVDSSDPENVAEAIRPNTKLIWVETPTNPLLKVTDLAAVAEIAKTNNLLFGVDTTFATPYLLRPLQWPVDFVLHSTTKYLSGHNQIIGGIIITNREDLYQQLRFVQKTTGAASSPFDCWLTLLGVKTLPLRMDKHSANGQAVAEYLQNHPKVSHVNYPGLASHPQHHIAKAQMTAFSGMLSFELTGGLEAGTTLMNNVKLCSLAESLGAVETMITHPASMTHASVPRADRLARGLTDGLVRLSVGIEDVEDIIADLEQALAKV
jgi:cystathionine beta-lyase/cystathionine gamma-synthase